MNAHDDNAETKRERLRRTWWLLARLRRLSPEVETSWREASQLISGLSDDTESSLTPQQCRILKTRWVEQAKMYERLWRGQRSVYYLVRVPIIVGATTIPVLASLGVDKLVTALVGLAVALLTALDSFFQLGTRWQQHRHTATELGFEGWEFLELAGGYAGEARQAAYKTFITQLEAMNRRAALTYLDLFRTAEKQDDSHK
jgi:hypothetical protein